MVRRAVLTSLILCAVTAAAIARPRTSTADTMTVVCLGPGGIDTPIAGALVKLRGQSDKTVRQLGEDQELRTDRNGQVRFERLDQAAYEVTVQAEGYYPLARDLVPPGERVVFLMRPGVPLSGTVISQETGDPLPGVQVNIYSRLDQLSVQSMVGRGRGEETSSTQSATTSDLPMFRTRCETGEDGSFRFDDVPSDYPFTLSFYDEFHEPFEQETSPIGDETWQDREYPLRGRSSIFGRVVDNLTGATIAGVLVRAGEGGIPIYAIEQFGGGAAILEGTSNELGEYRIDNVPRGRQHIAVRLIGYEPYVNEFEHNQDDAYQHEIRLVRAAVLQGQVVDSDGNPIGGARVERRTLADSALEGGQVPSTGTGPDGRFTMVDVPVGKPLTIRVVAEGFVTLDRDIELARGKPIHDLDIVLQPVRDLRGIVLDSAGSALPGVQVSVIPIGGDPSSTSTPIEPLLTNAAGVFQFAAIPTASIRFTAAFDGYATFEEVIEITEKPRKIELLRAAALEGVVVDGEGNPIPGARGQARLSGSPREPRSLQSNDDGRFTLANLAPGTWDLWVESSGFAPGRLADVELAEGANRSDLRVVLGNGGGIRGQVLKPGGANASLTMIRYRPLPTPGQPAARAKQAMSKPNGKFDVDRLAPGDYEVWPNHPRYASAPPQIVTVTNGQSTDLELQLADSCTFRARVLDIDRTVLGGVPVSLRIPQQEPSPRITELNGERTQVAAANGEVEWKKVPAGDYELVVETPGGQTVEKVHVGPEQETPHEIVVSGTP